MYGDDSAVLRVAIGSIEPTMRWANSEALSKISPVLLARSSPLDCKRALNIDELFGDHPATNQLVVMQTGVQMEHDSD